MAVIFAVVLVPACQKAVDQDVLQVEGQTQSDVSQADENGSQAAEITNSIGMKLQLIPAGEFTMGSSEGEEGRDEGDEGPAHRVRITRPFYMGAHEVTQGQWQRVMGSRLADMKKNERDFYGQGDDYPMYWVSWYDAVAFCNKLSEQEGRKPFYRIENVERETYGATPAIKKAKVTVMGGNGYRLPTEAQWEYACRASTTTRYYWGDSDAEGVMKHYCWYAQNADDGFWTSPHATEGGAQPVGQKRPNAWELYDMSGNVWEWCADWYGSDYYGTLPVDDPTGPTSGSYRVNRGGGWSNSARYCRSAFRNNTAPDARSHYLGFRVSRAAAEEAGK